MDNGHFARPQHQQHPHLGATSKHYSQRQQPTANGQANATHLATSSRELLPGTAGSGAAMLGGAHHGAGSHTLQSQQKQHLAAMQKQRHQHHQHRQAALHQAAHQLAAAGGPKGGASGYAAPNGGGGGGGGHKLLDNMTTSSSSDNTLDDLHQLAHGYGGSHHRLAARYEGAAGSSSSAGQSSGGGARLRAGLEQHQSGGRFLLGVLFTLAEMLLFLSLLLWLYWAYQHDDGLAWHTDRKQQFNTHGALMLAGFVFLNGQAMLIYRSFQCCNKIYTKILHTILFVLATSAISLGLILAYNAQENTGPASKPIMHFYSLHAWTGLATTGLFVLQFAFGFLSFLVLLCCDTATARFRAALLPIHRTFGLVIFSTAVATCLMGLLQTARSRLSSKLNKVDYHELSEAGLVVNLIGVCLICLAILMPYIIRNLDIKRPGADSHQERRLKLSQLDMRIG